MKKRLRLLVALLITLCVLGLAACDGGIKAGEIFKEETAQHEHAYGEWTSSFFISNLFISRGST